MTKAVEAVTSTDYLGMSDEDFLKVNVPDSAPAAEVNEKTEEEKAAEAAATAVAADEPVTKTPEEIAAEEAAAAATKLADEEEAKAAKAKEDADAAALEADPVAKAAAEAAAVAAAAGDPDKTKTNAEKKKAKADKEAADAATAAAAKAEADKGKTPEQIEADRIAAAAATEKPIDHKAFYEQVMKPFKANGRMIELKTPEEALRLMQMGAGYGRKLQDLQPHLKVIRMLEKADLLDEGKISYLIDINGNNPDAIKKKIKESGIDPLDLNIEDNVNYIPKNHSVTDQEMAFQNALSDIQGHEGGQETLKEINQNWDQESKSLLWKEPQLLQVIQSQRDNGIYAQIASEIDRQKLLGIIPNSTPFLKAYELAGNVLFPQVKQAPQIQTQPVVTPQPQVIATRTAAPVVTVKNSDKAAAAAATKSASTRKPAPVNPLAMADDDFMKAFSGRL